MGKTNKIGLFYMVVNAIRCHGNAATWVYYLYVCVCVQKKCGLAFEFIKNHEMFFR